MAEFAVKGRWEVESESGKLGVSPDSLVDIADSEAVPDKRKTRGPNIFQLTKL